MSKAWKLVRKLRQDEEGAALIEYSILVGIIAAGTIAAVTVVGGWIGGRWTILCTALGTSC